MIWKVNRIGVEQVWYSNDVIEKIKKIVNKNGCEFCDDLAGECEECVFTEIRKIIEEEENGEK